MYNSPIWSIDCSAIPFAFPVWQTNNGSALTTESSPNSSTPANSRVATLQAQLGAIIIPQQGTFRVIIVGGTSLTFVSWRYDAQRSTWDVIQNATTITQPNNIATIAASTGFLPGSQSFLQITGVVGTVTAFGYGFF